MKISTCNKIYKYVTITAQNILEDLPLEEHSEDMNATYKTITHLADEIEDIDNEINTNAEVT